ncbi:FlgK family flagellar hook-associated protein [Mobilicoccus pelagius]|uniref:Flagellar hook-associated protein FlgK helical domain-containing protein n=1 Tax=Mobilicoccus pelagius NBRC 104925 TaxID=1089455 RepID=H5USB9_9MICO|nr:hypothetical protein [Mobilicoccus pelagius]GAB48627.1 hypothetical protein MOPEL_078_00160 [Mobilicoccus pelagius NBRC 104925]
MTSMPDLSTAGRGVPLSVLGVSGRHDVTPSRETRTDPGAQTVDPLEPIGDSASVRAETRRLVADRYALETQSRTAEGLKEALAETSRQVQPQVADLRRLYEQPRPADEGAARAQEDATLAAATEAAQRTRASAARLAALRITNQEKAVRIAEEAVTDAHRLAELNDELTAQTPPTAARRTDIQARQRQLADGLAEKVGATIRENPDGTVDATLDDRALVVGGRAETLEVDRPVSSRPEPTPGGRPRRHLSGGPAPHRGAAPLPRPGARPAGRAGDALRAPGRRRHGSDGPPHRTGRGRYGPRRGAAPTRGPDGR